MGKSISYLYYIIIFVIIATLLSVGIFFLLISFNSSFKEKFIVKKHAEALIKGERLMENSKAARKFNKHQAKIRNKFMIFCFVLVVAITFGSGILITKKVENLEKRNLGENLAERLNILSLSILSGVSYYMPSQKVLEINSVCGLADNVPEIKSVTVLGPQLELYDIDGVSQTYVWYSNDPDIALKVDDMSVGFGYMRYLADDMGIDKIISDADKIIADEVYPLINRQEYVSKKIITLAENPDENSGNEMSDLQNDYFDLDEEINSRLSVYSNSFSGFYPDFNVSDFSLSNLKSIGKNSDEGFGQKKNDGTFVYWQPIIYRQLNSPNFVHGIILIDFSTDILLKKLDSECSKIVRLSILFGIIANVIALLGSYIMATVVTNPIKELESHLRRIGLSRDRTKLDKLQIHVTSRDEIGRLGQIVNEMTKQLGAAAKEEQLLVDAKAIQQAFLPMVVMNSGIKRNIAYKKTDTIDFFGYFEGAATVSGDYFDYRRLDKDWYVIIKCDASGHGFAAAIIMTIIATLFRNYFGHWTYEKNGISINHFINQVNQFISSLNIDGRFASMLVCLINSQSGELYMSNAGDNLVHIYDSILKKIKTIELFSAPVVGPFNPVLINQMGGFKVEKILLKPGDMLLLYTDGIEESFRTCRNSNYEAIQIDGDVPGTKKAKLESFGQRNILRIVEAVMNHEVFVLEKMDNPNEDEILEFDFTGCPGTTEDVVTAVAAIEKVFRMFKPASALKTDYISVDKQIDLFLKKYFNLYNEYCLEKSEASDDYIFSNYIDYEYLMEDEQKDDLTLFVMKYK